MDKSEILKKVNEALANMSSEKQKMKSQTEQERRELITSIGGDIVNALSPYLGKISEQGKLNKADLQEVISQLKIEVPKSDPIKLPEFPKIPTPIVNYTPPAIHMPEMKMPEEMDIKGWVRLMGVDLDHPLPVQLRDAGGKAVNLLDALNKQVVGSSGKADFFTIKGFGQSAYSDFTNADGRLRVSVETGGSGLTDSELRASSVPVAQASGALWSMAVKEIFGSTVASLFNGDNRIPVSVETGGSGLTDSELRASSIGVMQVSGFADSVSVVDIFGSTAANIVNPDGRLKVELPTGASGLTDTELRAAHLDVQQVSGAIDSVYVTGFGASVAASIVDSSGVGYSGSNPLPVSGTVLVSDITASLKSALVDSSGVQYSGSNPVPVGISASLETKQVSGFSYSVFVTGFADSSIAYEVMTTNKTAKADGADIRPKADDLGRQITRPVQVRDLIATAYVAVTNGTETTLLAATAGSYHDLIMVVGSNNSDAAVSVDIRAVTGGNILNTLRIPANGTAGWTPAVPWPQDATGNAWTVDGPDETGRTLTFSALFSREV